MKSAIRFREIGLFNLALSVLALESAPDYESNLADLTISCNDIDAIVALLNDNGIFMFDV